MRCLAGIYFEIFGKVALGRKSQIGCNLAIGIIGIDQQVLGTGYFFTDNIL